MLQAVRDFFHTHSFIEVETPVRVVAPAPELHIDAEPAGDRWLRTSPELEMKRIVAAGVPRIYQLGPCFRRGETGAHHNPEFTMLEWYRTGGDYMDVLADAKGLIAHVVRKIHGKTHFDYLGKTVDVLPVWEWSTVSNAYLEHAGWDPLKDYDADRFDMDMVTKIEPNLSKSSPYVLKDFPTQCAALAKINPGPPPYSERWELYLCGIELANAFTELTDPVEQLARFEASIAERTSLGKDEYPVDGRFLNALKAGLPDCAGVALGIDRLIMILAGEERIENIRFV